MNSTINVKLLRRCPRRNSADRYAYENISSQTLPVTILSYQSQLHTDMLERLPIISRDQRKVIDTFELINEEFRCSPNRNRIVHVYQGGNEAGHQWRNNYYYILYTSYGSGKKQLMRDEVADFCSLDWPTRSPSYKHPSTTIVLRSSWYTFQRKSTSSTETN